MQPKISVYFCTEKYKLTRFILAIILKCIEILNRHVVHQELTQGCSSVIFQKQTSKQTHRKREEIKFVVTRAEG